MISHMLISEEVFPLQEMYNDDGYNDVIVGAFLYDNDQTDEGRIFCISRFSCRIVRNSKLDC
ncbi:MAG: hypothetical protein IPN57_16520 [Ignavibacteria bacterium]|nr:hypothetical protein [Ignavibacteria bacterium]